MSIDFASLAASLLASASTLVPSWLPAGKRKGDEWVLGGLNGDPGSSLSINLTTGKWMDFATGDKGGDLISLYAAIHSIPQLQAAKELGADDTPVRAPPTRQSERKPALIEAPAEPPPADAPEPGPHYKHGPHTALYRYAGSDGGTLFYVARYDLAGERKQFSPWRWLGGRWEAKAYPKPRPLYGLDRLAQAPAARRVMLVEGEKACDALAPLLTRSHVVMTWAGGAKAVGTADWSALAGRRVDLWPDADDAGREAAAALAPLLYGLGCRPVRIVIPDGQPEGWDAADAVAAGLGKDEIVQWIARDGGRFLREYEPPAEPGQPAESVPPSDLPPSADLVPRAHEPKVVSVRDERSLWQSLGLETNIGNGVPPANEDTVDRVLSHPTHAGAFWFDTFLQRPMTNLPQGWTTFETVAEARPLHDSDFSSLTVYLQRHLRLHKMSAGRARAGLELYVFKHHRNCAQDWLNGLQWDGVERIGSMLVVAFGAPDDDYTVAVSRNFLIGMVARVLDPGCQVDYMPILEGGQGNGKSSALRALGGEYFTESTEGVETKDFLQNLRGKMLVEIGELHQFNKADVAKIKQVITNRVDTYRASYGRTAGDYPRQCVFAGTTNRDDWNHDETGARRFWRIQTSRIDVAWITANREQLFAEAVAAYKAGATYWKVPDTEARRLQDAAREREGWHDAIAQFIATRSWVTPAEILIDSAIQKPLGDHTRDMIRRVCGVLRLEGWEKSSQWINGKSRTAWRRSRIENGPEVAPEAAEVTDIASLADQWSSE